MTNAEARFNNCLRPRKPEGSLGRTAQDGHLDSHTAPKLCFLRPMIADLNTTLCDPKKWRSNKSRTFRKFPLNIKSIWCLPQPVLGSAETADKLPGAVVIWVGSGIIEFTGSDASCYQVPLGWPQGRSLLID